MALTAQQVQAMDIREVVAYDDWQDVRKSLIGNWVSKHELNVSALRDYLTLMNWSPLSVRQVYNVLTGSVHRAGHTVGQASTDQLRKEVRIAWFEMTGRPYNPKDPRFALGVIGAGLKEAFPE